MRMTDDLLTLYHVRPTRKMKNRALWPCPILQSSRKTGDSAAGTSTHPTASPIPPPLPRKAYVGTEDGITRIQGRGQLQCLSAASDSHSSEPDQASRPFIGLCSSPPNERAQPSQGLLPRTRRRRPVRRCSSSSHEEARQGSEPRNSQSDAPEQSRHH
jgi:hypothetical protein